VGVEQLVKKYITYKSDGRGGGAAPAGLMNGRREKGGAKGLVNPQPAKPPWSPCGAERVAEKKRMCSATGRETNPRKTSTLLVSRFGGEGW